MKISLVAQSTLLLDETKNVAEDARFRKATSNMILATLACEHVLQNLPSKDVSLVLGTHFGEVESTLDFLNNYHLTQVPSPILFQNSLHNSTLGFVTLHLGLHGPAMTVSADHETVSSAFKTAENLLQLTPCVMVCLVDCIPESLVSHYLANFPFMNKHINRAACFALTKPETAKAAHLLELDFASVF